MTLHDIWRILRTRWLTVCITTLAVLLGAVAYSLLTTPLYQASTRLFVSAITPGNSGSDLYNSNRTSQERVLSYAELITGTTLAQRTIDKLDLDTTASSLKSRVKATVKADTVLIDVDVLDPSPVRARDIANALSDEFVIMVRELETPRPGSQPDARVVVEQRALIPNAPVVPKTARNVVLGLFMGGLLGVGFALLRDRLDNTIKDPGKLAELTHVGVVGEIPLDKKLRENRTIVFENDNSRTAEALRKLRTNLQFLSVDNPPRLIVVTSSTPSEGKSTTAINIALALAEAEHEVVLVEGDMRRPMIGKYMNLVDAVGFSTVISGAVELDEALQQTAYPHLTVLTAGATPPNPSEIIGSMAAKKVLDELREKFDYVIVDSPPLLAVTDAALLAAHSDGALMISRFGRTTREQVTHSVESLAKVGATLLGAVMTMAPARGAGAYGYYGYYGYYGGYYDQRKTDDKSSPVRALPAPPSAGVEKSEPEYAEASRKTPEKSEASEASQ